MTGVKMVCNVLRYLHSEYDVDMPLNPWYNPNDTYKTRCTWCNDNDDVNDVVSDNEKM